MVNLIFLKILKTQLLLLILICYLLKNVSRLQKEEACFKRELFFLKNTFVNILILFARVNLWLKKRVQWRKKCIIDSTKSPQLHNGFIASWKWEVNHVRLHWNSWGRKVLSYKYFSGEDIVWRLFRWKRGEM